jgi:hypothetical protein
LYSILCRLRFGTAPAAEESKKARCSSAAFPKLFIFREGGMQVPLVTMSCPSPRTAAPRPCLPLGIKDSLKEVVRLFGWGRFFGCGSLFDGGVLAEGKIPGGRLLKGGK